MVTGVMGGRKSARETEVCPCIYLPMCFVSSLVINQKLSPDGDHRSNSTPMTTKPDNQAN